MKKIFLFSIIALFALTGCALSLSGNTEDGDAPQDLIFAVIGDNEGDTPAYRSFLEAVAQDNNIAFIVHVGDVTSHGESSELEQIKALHDSYNISIPIYAVPGNHDIKEDAERVAFMNSFGELPRSIEYENLHLVLLDNADRKIGFSEDTLDWLRDDLSHVQNKKVVLVYHRPFGYPFAETLGDDETSISRASNKAFQSIIASHDIAYILNGHIHGFIEYHFAITNDDKEITSTISAVISGGGGQAPQDIFSTFLKEDFHYLKVHVTEQGIMIEKKSIN